MKPLILTLTGMALTGYGPRGEAWLVNTDVITSPNHHHKYELAVGQNHHQEIKGGQLIEIYDGPTRLGGPVDFSGIRDRLVDLDALLSTSATPPVRIPPALRMELTTPAPAAGGPWTAFLAAWIRLPGGPAVAISVAQPRPADFWPFPLDPDRGLTEHVFIVVPDVTEPVIVLTPPTGPEQRVPIPFEQEAYRLFFTAMFSGTPTPTPHVGDDFKLEEVVLHYGCLSNATDGAVPERIFTQEDLIALPRQTNDVSICPPGCIELQ